MSTGHGAWEHDAPCPDLPGYVVTDAGQVWSVASLRPVRPRLNPRDGRRYVKLRRLGRRVERRVDRLVASAFLGPRGAGWTVVHLDGDPTNDAASNLRWQREAET